MVTAVASIFMQWQKRARKAEPHRKVHARKDSEFRMVRSKEVIVITHQAFIGMLVFCEVSVAAPGGKLSCCYYPLVYPVNEPTSPYKACQ